MTLVEWTRIEPGQVEAVVAMLLNRERPTSVRITPSRGDGGVDILDRGAAEGGGDVVYQVKSYTGSIGAREKASIKDSLDTLRSDERWAGLSVVSWRLVAPLNPSPEAENWLLDLGAGAGLPTVWHGEDFVEQLAAKYPDVIDYYLRGGAARIKEAQAEVFALVGLERVDVTASFEEVTGRIQTALGVLNHHPHYRFEVRFGAGEPPLEQDRPGLVLRTVRGERPGGDWVSVDVIARCAASTAVDPITISGTITAERDSDLARDYEAFVVYGAPFVAKGAFTGALVAPGDLGGPIENASVWAGPTSDADVGDDPELHLDLLDRDGNVVAEVDVDRVEVTRGQHGGLRAVLREVNGIFELEDRLNPQELSGTRQLHITGITGIPVAAALVGLRFLAAMEPPNRLRVSRRHGSRARGVIDDRAFTRREDQQKFFRAAVQRLELLGTLQEHADPVIRTPDFARVPNEQIWTWHVAATLLRGEALIGTIEEGHGLHIGLESEVDVDDTFAVTARHVVQVGDQQVDLGYYELLLENPTLVNRVAVEGGFRHVFTTADGTFTRRLSRASWE
jgi:hypothetical protein